MQSESFSSCMLDFLHISRPRGHDRDNARNRSDIRPSCHRDCMLNPAAVLKSAATDMAMDDMKKGIASFQSFQNQTLQVICASDSLPMLLHDCSNGSGTNQLNGTIC